VNQLILYFPIKSVQIVDVNDSLRTNAVENDDHLMNRLQLAYTTPYDIIRASFIVVVLLG